MYPFIWERPIGKRANLVAPSAERREEDMTRH